MTIRILMLAAIAAFLLPGVANAVDGASCSAPAHHSGWTCIVLCDAKTAGATTCAEVDIEALGVEPVLLELVSWTGCTAEPKVTVHSRMVSASAVTSPFRSVTTTRPFMGLTRPPFAEAGYPDYLATTLSSTAGCSDLTVKLYLQ